MPHLSLSLLGLFQATLDGQPVTAFKSNKVRALLAYLAVEADRPHPREVLAGLLWPEWTDREALGNLRYALSDLRGVIGDRTAEPPFLLIARDTLQFNTASDFFLDVRAFAHLTEPALSSSKGAEELSGLQEAVSLYGGDFLEGFSLPDAAPFEEWALLTRERLACQVSSTLHRLSEAYEERGEYEQAESYARRQLELDPWDEVAHQRLMRALALSGLRSAALAQYETCRRLLAEELEVEPDHGTTEVFHQIRDGKLGAPASPALPLHLVPEPPRFLAEEPVEVERPVFVARERELARLSGFLDLALTGHGRMVFVTGEAGSGKTALVQEFVRRALDTQVDLVAASGNCNAHTGMGDPYLPFREILGLLTGDVEARWAAGAITGEHARRLWDILPRTAQALVEAGPDLVETLVAGGPLLDRAVACAPGERVWPARLTELVERRTAGAVIPGPQQQRDLFDQYIRVLQAVTRRVPLVLVIDDLQWADVGSINLLFHLGRQLAGSRVLVICAYRPEEVAIGRDGERHPLESVVNELHREFGDVVVDVEQAESQDFVEAFLDSEPNRLGAAFRERLLRQTRGHPLFTVELLRGMQERGELVQDSKGRWVEGPDLDWGTLPARVEAACAERIGRLAQPLQAALRVASVEGEDFTAEVVAGVLGTDERETVQLLSGELDRRHRLVRALTISRLQSGRVSRYRFRHDLFQKYLYEKLDEVERAYLHEDVGSGLEQLYGDQASEIAVHLARHFKEAGVAHKAVQYLYLAGERAVQLSAYEDGIAHLTRGLALLGTLPETAERTERELALQLGLGLAWQGGKGPQAPEAKQVFSRARELCQQVGKTSQLCRVLGDLSMHHYVRAEYLLARDLAQEALSLAQQESDPLLVMLGHWYLGFVSFGLGQYATARSHLEQVISFYDPRQHHQPFVALRGVDAGPSALAYDACCLWCLGYPEQALKRREEALALAGELGHPFTMADVLCYGGCVFDQMRGDGQALQDSGEKLILLTGDKVSSWSASVRCFQGAATAMLGHVAKLSLIHI